LTFRGGGLVSTTVDPTGRPDDRQALRVAIGIGLPLGLVVLAYMLWAISDRLVYIGPLDPAAFGWAVVTPLWLSSPVAAGFIWRSLTPGHTRIAAGVVGAVTSSVAALLFWGVIGTPFDCGFGTVTPAIDFLPQTLIVGVLVGGGLAISGLLVTELVCAGVRWWAVVIGAGSEAVLLIVALFIAFAALGGHTCYVPGPAFPVPS